MPFFGGCGDSPASGLCQSFDMFDYSAVCERVFAPIAGNPPAVAERRPPALSTPEAPRQWPVAARKAA
jgi:hypothetical protein